MKSKHNAVRNIVYLAGVAFSLGLGVVLLLAGEGDLAEVAWVAVALTGAAVLVIRVARDIIARRAGVDVIALLAIGGSLALGEYLAGAVITLMLATGQTLEAYATARSQRELTALIERAPRRVHRYDGDLLVETRPDDIRPGDILMVRPGEIVPVDGIVVSDMAVLDESALTGEAQPVERQAREHVSSGVANAGAPFDLTATATAEGSTYAGIIRLVAQAQEHKAPFVRMADRYALIFVPATLVLAACAWLLSGDPIRGLSVLVVATPCPLILAAPIALVSGMSRAARRGVIIKGGAALEALAEGRVLLFDKTGTLTEGRPEVTAIETTSETFAEGDLLRLAASVEQMSPHVMAAAIVHAARRRGLPLSLPSNVEEETGMGAVGNVDGHEVRIGRLEWVSREPPPAWSRRLRRRAAFEDFVTTFVSIDDRLVGALILEDPLRPDTARTLRTIRASGVQRIVMVTGDRSEIAEGIGAVVGTDAVFAERTPDEKVAIVREEGANGRTIMVGDGINDAPALAAADVGVAMGARGATAASQAGDVVLLVDRLDRLAEALNVARRSRSIALQSVLAGMSLSFVAMGFAAGGFIGPVAGALLQETIDVAVILNALRALGGYKSHTVSSGPLPPLAQRFQAEHAELLPLVSDLRRLADRLEGGENGSVIREIRRLYADLASRLQPHEDAEEHQLYPEIASILGGEDPTGTMSRAHVEIAHSIRLLGFLLEELDGESDPADIIDLRRVMYGLHALLRLHFSQEEQAYFSLAESEQAHRPWDTGVA
jgi:heavy metal translocating P-type ATPase